MTNSNGKNRKKHRKALENPVTAAMHKEFVEEWKEENLVQRGDRVIKLVDRGCTERGLAHDIGVKGGTIVRWKQTAELPSAERAAVEGGQSATPFLRAAAQDERKAVQRERTATLKGKQKELDRLVRLIIKFLDKMGYAWSEHRLILLNELQGQVWYHLQLYRRDPLRWPLPPLAPAGADPMTVIASIKIVPDDNFFMTARISAHVVQLLRALLMLIADHELLGRAIEKAMSIYNTKAFEIPGVKPAA